MSKKKLLPIIVLIAVLVAAVSATLICMRACNSGGSETTPNETVTVTFDAKGGSKVQPITVNKGETLDDLPQAYFAGMSFDGWYTDEGVTEEFSVDTAIDRDMTLYAGYTEVLLDVDVTENTTLLMENVKPNHAVTIITPKDYSGNIFDDIKIESVTSVLPWDFPDLLDDNLPKKIEDWYILTSTDSEYTLMPKEIMFNGDGIYAYTEGKLYKITIPQTMRFKGLEDSVVEYSFRIEESVKDSVEDNVEYKDEENIRFVKKEEILNIEDITDPEKEEGSGISKGDNGYYNLLFSAESYKKYKFNTDCILCIGNGEELDTESLFVKVAEVAVNVHDGANEYLVLAKDAEVEDVFESIDVNYNRPISADEIIANLDTEEILETVKTNGSVDKVTNLMTKLLLVSDEVQSVYEEDYKATQYASGIDPNTGLPDFCSNTYISQEATLLNFNLLKGAEVSISVGVGHNPNFDSAYTDDFIALKITFAYSTTIKDRLEIKSEIEFKQFLAASAQGYLDYKWGVFTLKWAEFDAAINLYSQTDFDFKIFVRTIKPDGVDSNNGNSGNNGNGGNNGSADKNDDDDSFVDIAEKIAEKLKSDEGDDPNNLVAELKDMLESENGYLELFKAPILRIPIDIIPGIPVMTVNVELDFLIEMNFAAGFSAHMSVLEAVQIGVKGDTRTKTVESYKHDNLLGGNQYAVSLSACGYLGVRAGFKGGLSVGFCGLSSLGKVGVYVFVGPYVDIYGFAQATFVKQNGKVSQSLVGGYYVEIGIFLDVTLEAKSDMFGTKVGTSLYNDKWPLVKFGNKEVLIAILPNDLVETIYIENKGEDTASISVNLLPKLQGTYLDITTGETTVKDVPWGKVGLRMSSPSFVYDASTQTINYRNLHGTKLISETCFATYHYNGSILQFNATAAQYKEFYPFAQVKVVYYDSTQIDKEDVGKEVKVRFYSLVDGKKELLEERNVMTGARLYEYPTLDPYKYDKISWDKVPHTTQITKDTDFVCSAELRQVYIAFIHYSVENDVYITDIRACNIGEVPIAPEVKSGGKANFKCWYGYDGINCDVKHTSSEGIGRTFTVGDMWKYGYFIDTTSGKDVTKSIITYVPEIYDADIYASMFDTEHLSDSGMSWYYAVTSIYVAGFEYDDCIVTIYSEDVSGTVHKDEFPVAYKRYLTTYYTYSPLYMKFMGFALEKDGEVVYKDTYELGVLRDDVVLYAIYERAVHEIKLYTYNAATNEYTLYKTTTLNGGQRVYELGSVLDELKKIDEAEGVECEYAWFIDDDGYLSEDSICASPMNIYPYFHRTVKVVFDANGGVIPVGENEAVEQMDYFTESKLGYKINFALTCIKTEDDPKWRYEHVGWENEVTKEKFYFKDPSNKIIDMKCDRVTTLKAIYQPIERTDYSVSIKTPYGTLKDGSKEIVLDNLTWEEFSEYKTTYDAWTPENYRDDENHCTYVQKGIINKSNENKYDIEYVFEPEVDRHTVEFDFNGGETGDNIVVHKDVDWNSAIDLSTKTSTRVDEYGTWVMKSWSDSYGNEYSLDDTYYVLGDDVLTLNWEISTYKEYKISFYLDDKLIDTKTYCKGESLASIGKPQEADGKVFSGWTWTDAMTYEEIEPKTEMPARNLYLSGTTYTVYISYVVDGKEIDKSVGKVSYEETVKDGYVKEGYSVAPWATQDVEVTGGKFIMPEKDVVFTATTTANKYKLTYCHKGKVYIAEQEIVYGSSVRLPQVPVEEGIEYVWASNDVRLYDSGFYMPANDVVINSVSVESMKYVIYYVNDEIVSYEKAVTGQKLELTAAPQSKYDGMTFSGWYSFNALIQSDSTFIVGNENIYVYGYFTTGTTKVNVYFSETATTPDLVLYANDGDKLTLSLKINDKDIVGYKLNGNASPYITVSGEEEIDVYVQYEAKKYQVSYTGYGFTLPQNEHYAVGTRVALPETPQGLDYQKFEGWFSAEAELLTDENGKNYFIMPEKDVVINVKYDTKSTVQEGYKTAKVYINSPYSGEPLFFKDYVVDNDDAPVYFDEPQIEGYEFVCWKDSNGQTVNGIKLSDMSSEVCNYYGEYRKTELHIAEFRINNEVVGYREFYDFYEVRIITPSVELKVGERFTGWNNFFVKTVMFGNEMLFYTGENSSYEYAGMDFVFNGCIYLEEDSYFADVTYQDQTGEYSYVLHVNDDSQLKFDRYYNGNEVEYRLIVLYYIAADESSYEMPLNGVVTVQGDECVITIQSISEIKKILGMGENDEVYGFRITASPKVGYSADKA